jgi:soluble lytic murein transglycosylase-like protein
VEAFAGPGLVRGWAEPTGLRLTSGTIPHLALGEVDAAAMSGSVGEQIRRGGLGIPWLPSPVARWADYFETAGEAHRVDPGLLAIMALVESGGRPDVTSHAGAVGLMQVMPATAQDIARWRGLEAPDTGALREPILNIDFGGYYVARMFGRFGSVTGGDPDRAVELTAAAYNGGPGAAQRWLDGGQLPAETQRYRDYVLGMWRERRLPESGTFGRWCRAGGQRLLPPPHCPAG